MTLAASVTYAAVLLCFIVWAGYLDASQFRLPTTANRKAAAAALQLQTGSRLIASRPDQGRGLLRRAIVLWEALVREVPSEPDYRINLAVTRKNLGCMLIAQGRDKEAEEELNRLPRYRGVVGKPATSDEASSRSTNFATGCEPSGTLC